MLSQVQSRREIHSFLVLRGIANHRPPEHWQFWLSAQLAAAGHQVLYPGLPSPDTPSYASWAAIVHGHLAEMDAPCRTVICHSLSCILWLSLGPQVPRTLRPERVLLVAPPDPLCVPPAGHEFILPFSATAAAASAMQELRVVCADNDPYNPAGARGMYGERLGCPVDVLEHAAYATPESGYGPWPSLASWCLGYAERVLANSSITAAVEKRT